MWVEVSVGDVGLRTNIYLGRSHTEMLVALLPRLAGVCFSKEAPLP